MRLKDWLWHAVRAAISVAPPALALVHWNWIDRHPLIAALLGVCYVVLAGFTWQVWQILRADWAQRLATWIDVKLRRQLTGFDRRYRRAIGNLHRYLDQSGLSNIGEVSPELDDVFVDVSVAPEQPGRIQSGVIPTKPTADNQDAGQGGRSQGLAGVVGSLDRAPIWSFLHGTGPAAVKLAVVGAPGGGKTTLLQHIARHPDGRRGRFPRRRQLVPALIFLRDCAATITGDARVSLPDLIGTQIEDVVGRAPVGWFDQRLRAGRCIVMFDGLDEIARQEDRRAVLTWIHRQAARYSGNYYIVTSRPHGYWDYPLDGATVLQVRQFTTVQIRAFVHGWYRAAERLPVVKGAGRSERRALADADKLLVKINQTPELAKLAVNPLLLTMIVQVHRCTDVELPGTRPALYAEMCRVLLERRDIGKNLADPLAMRPGQKQQVLSQLAYAMTISRVQKLSGKRAAAAIRVPLATASATVDPQEFLANARASGLLLLERDSYSFVHETFREFLCAACISTSVQVRMLLSNVADPWWRETIVFYAARAGANRVVEACLNSDQIGALALAFECADADANLDEGLRDRLKELLTDAANPGVPIERRRLAAAVLATRQLRDTAELADGARLCIAPMSTELYSLFTCQLHEEFSKPPGDEPSSFPVVGVSADEVAAFIDWLNGLLLGEMIGGQPSHYRLPTRAETDDPGFRNNPLAANYCVWLAPSAETNELELWTPPGVPHPYSISLGQLRERADADIAGSAGRALAAVLAVALSHALAIADTLALAHQRSRAHILAYDLRDKLEQACDLSRALVGSVVPDGGNVGSTLSSALDFIIAATVPSDSAVQLAYDIGATVGISADHAIELAFDLARARAYDLALALRTVLHGAVADYLAPVPAVPVIRLSGKLRDSVRSISPLFARALDGALDEALNLARQIEVDLDLPMCMQAALVAPTENGQRDVVDLIWGPVFDMTARGHEDRVVLPGALNKLAREGFLRVQQVLTHNDAAPVRQRLATVAERICNLVSNCSRRERMIPAEEITYIRLGALTVAANIIQIADKVWLANWYMEIAAGITILERRTSGQAKKNEVVMLVQE